MTKELTLAVLKRTEKNVNTIKKQGYIPGILYGAKTENTNIKVRKIDLQKVHDQVGESSLFNIELDGKKSKVIIKDFQLSPLKHDVIHVDFYQVDMAKKIEVELPLNFIGESKAVKNLGGVLSINHDKIKVSCLPEDLLENFDVDLSVLDNFTDAIRVSDLTLPKSFEIMLNPADLIVNVLQPAKVVEKEEAAATEAPKAEDAKAEDADKKNEKEAAAK